MNRSRNGGSFFVWLLLTAGINVLALIVINWLFDSVRIEGFWSYFLGALTLTVGNAFIKPVLAFLTLPLIVFTLGLAYFALNVAMLALAEWVAPRFTIDGFWTYVGATVVVSFVNWVLGMAFARMATPVRSRRTSEVGEMTGGLDDAVRRRAYQLSLEAPDATPEENWDRARRELEAELGVLYDTNDLRLQQLEMALTRIAVNGEVVWRLRLARGELIEAPAPPNDPERLPDDIVGLLSGVIGDEAIAPAPTFLLDAGLARLHAMLGEQRRALLTHEAGVRIGADPENLHKHRVAARRARAFLRATRHLTAAEWSEPLNEGLRVLGKLTGPVRDLDVLIEYVDTQRPNLGDDDQPGVERLCAQLRIERETRREALLAGLASDEYRALIEALDAPPQLAGEIESIPLDDIAHASSGGS